MDTIERNTDAPVNRRSFLIGTAAAGAGLTFGYSLLPVVTGSASEAFAANNWTPVPSFTIEPTGIITLHTPKSEIGQHVGTAIAQSLMEELEGDWKDVRIDYPDPAPKYGVFFTAGSLSILTTFMGSAQAGAAGRIALIEAGAKMLGQKAEECHASKGWVIGKGGRKVSYAQLVAMGKVDKVYSPDDLKKMPLKKATQYTVVGKPIQALDIPPKVVGKANYGIDYFLPNMVYAKIARPPVRIGAKPKMNAGKEAIDDSEAKKVPGYMQYLSFPDPIGVNTHYVVAIATNFPAAIKAAKAIKIDWDLGPNADVSSDGILQHAKDLVNNPSSGGAFWVIGDAKKALASAPTKIEAEFITPLASHQPIEPMNAVAYIDNGTLHLYSGSQLQIAHQPIMAAVMGMKPEQVLLHQVYVGGGFGRRLEADAMIPTALAAKQLGRPVKLIYTRDEEFRNDFYRTITFQRLQGGIDKGGNLIALQHDVCAAFSAVRAAPNMLIPALDNKNVKLDGTSLDGSNSWYGVPNYLSRGIENDLGQRATPPGFLRSVSTGWTYFALESFLDEVAHKTGKDPVEFRLAMLKAIGPNKGAIPMSIGGAERIANVIKKAAQITDFKKKHGRLGPGRGIGLAATTHFRDTPTWTCGVVEVAVDKRSGKITVQKITTVLDLGQAVNMDGARSQCEGGTLFGLSLALYEQASMHNGNLDQTNFDTYFPLRISEAPEVEVHIISTPGMPPVGVGEPAVTTVAPAVSNAVFDAVGVRPRDLPFTPEKVKALLKA
jgi:isoquinoline 1-oxidoreductase subunit beta